MGYGWCWDDEVMKDWRAEPDEAIPTAAAAAATVGGKQEMRMGNGWHWGDGV
jgi:hypothetical protein